MLALVGPPPISKSHGVQNEQSARKKKSLKRRLKCGEKTVVVEAPGSGHVYDTAFVIGKNMTRETFVELLTLRVPTLQQATAIRVFDGQSLTKEILPGCLVVCETGTLVVVPTKRIMATLKLVGSFKPSIYINALSPIEWSRDGVRVLGVDGVSHLGGSDWWRSYDEPVACSWSPDESKILMVWARRVPEIHYLTHRHGVWVHRDVRELMQLGPSDSHRRITCGVWNKRDELIYIGRYGSIETYNGDTGVCCGPVITKLSTLSGMEFNPTFTMLATSSQCRSVSVWDASTYKLLYKLHSSQFGGNLTRIRWSPNGVYLAVSGQKTVAIWHVKTKRILLQIPMLDGVYTSNPAFVVWDPKSLGVFYSHKSSAFFYKSFYAGLDDKPGKAVRTDTACWYGYTIVPYRAFCHPTRKTLMSRDKEFQILYTEDSGLQKQKQKQTK